MPKENPYDDLTAFGFDALREYGPSLFGGGSNKGVKDFFPLGEDFTFSTYGNLSDPSEFDATGLFKGL